MISTFLVLHADLVPVFFWLTLAAGALLGWLLHRSDRQHALLALAILGLISPLALTLSPASGSPDAFCTVQFSVPFQGIDTLANLAMLVPLALFASLRFRRPLRTFAAVSGLSALIELTQAFLPALGRSCDTDDWFMNTIGAALGTLVAAGIIALGRRRARTPIDSTPEAHPTTR